MAKIKIWPHHELCPDGAEIVTVPGETICEAALREGIKIEHACEMSCACTTCHCIIRKGFDSLEEASDIEEDMLDKAWGLEQTSRLSCQTIPPVDENIENLEIDTYAEKEFFYSYRRSCVNNEPDYGRCISVILMT